MNLKSIIEKRLNDSIERIKSNLATTGTNTKSMRTSNSLRLESSDFGFIIYGREAFRTVESGRMAGGIPKGFNDIIKQWIKDKGILFGENGVCGLPLNQHQIENSYPTASGFLQGATNN